MKVIKQPDGLYAVMDGSRLVDGGLTSRKAWWLHDRLTGEIASKSESTSEWVTKKMSDNAK